MRSWAILSFTFFFNQNQFEGKYLVAVVLVVFVVVVVGSGGCGG